MKMIIAPAILSAHADCQIRRATQHTLDLAIQSSALVMALGETIRLMCEVDGVIESAGGWPVK